MQPNARRGPPGPPGGWGGHTPLSAGLSGLSPSVPYDALSRDQRGLPPGLLPPPPPPSGAGRPPPQQVSDLNLEAPAWVPEDTSNAGELFMGSEPARHAAGAGGSGFLGVGGVGGGEGADEGLGVGPGLGGGA